MSKTVEMRLTHVPIEVYDVLLAMKHEEEKRLRRGCNFTDGLKRLANEYANAISRGKELEAEIELIKSKTE